MTAREAGERLARRTQRPYIPFVLERLADDLWTASCPLRFLGVETGTRMTVVRLAGGGLFVHSPIALDAELRAAVDAIGPVVAIVAPSRFHHLFVSDWTNAYPDAAVLASPGLPAKRRDIAWSGVLGDAPEAAWRGEIEQVFFAAWPMASEVVFFHRASRTILCADLIFALGSHPSGLTRFVARLVGNREPGTTLLERVTIRDRAAAKEQIARIVGWDAERLVLAHGTPIASDAAAVVRHAYRWL